MRVGFACIPLDLGCSVARTCRLVNATDQKLDELIRLNLASLDAAIDYVARLGLSLFRISSDTIPFGSHPVNRLRWWSLHRRTLREIGKKAARLGVRLSVHPGQFTLLNSPSERVTSASLKDLEYHVRLLDALGCPASSKIILHLGGAYGDKPASLDRLRSRISVLPPDIKSRLVLENDDRVWSAREALAMVEQVSLPMVFDDFHHRVLPSEPPLSAREALRLAAATWKPKDGAMEVHFSSQRAGARPGSHADGIVESELAALLEAAEGLDFDLMVEAKGKERAALSALNVIRLWRRH